MEILQYIGELLLNTTLQKVQESLGLWKETKETRGHSSLLFQQEIIFNVVYVMQLPSKWR